MNLQGEQSRMNGYRDILSDRDYASDFKFMTKRWEPQPTFKSKSKTDPETLKQDVIHSPRVEKLISELMAETGKTRYEMITETYKILDEMGHDRKLSVIRWVGYLLIKILKKTCSGLMVNEPSIQKVKAAMGKFPMIFVPSHRSYADFILLSYICYCYDIDIPVVAAGNDFQNMYGMGHVLRNCCAFFMRRSFGDDGNIDKLYWTVLGEYICKVITDNESPLEFFIEGTRSRSAKSLPPRFGLLTMALRPFFTQEVEDLIIVPINISYERTLEETLFAYEVLGVPKPKESTSGLLKALNFMAGLYGRTYVDFGEPISVKRFLNLPKYEAESFDYLGPKRSRAHEAENASIVDLAFWIIRQQQEHVVLTPFNLVAVILSDAFFSRPRNITKNSLALEMMWLKSVFEVLGAVMDFQDGVDAEIILERALAPHENLVSCSADGTILLCRVHECPPGPKYTVTPGADLFHETMEIATPVALLYLYVNPCMKALICPALIILTMQAHDSTTGKMFTGDLFKQYCFLRVAFFHEFVLHRSFALDDFDKYLLLLERLKVVYMPSGKEVAFGGNVKLQALLGGLLRPFMYSYYILCITVKGSEVPLSQPELLVSVQKSLELFMINAYPIHPYSLSQEILRCGIRSLVSLNAILRLKFRNTWRYISGPDIDFVLAQFDRFIPWQYGSGAKEPFLAGPPPRMWELTSELHSLVPSPNSLESGDFSDCLHTEGYNEESDGPNHKSKL